MSEPFLSELRIFAFNFPPKGWAFCDGRLLPINQNQALFSLLGTTYGGDGITTFALPNLQGRVPIHMGSGHTLGEVGGQQNHTLSVGELPTHGHVLNATSSRANTGMPNNELLARASSQAYAPGPSPLSTLAAGALTPTGGSQAHNNMQPYLVLNVCMALAGIFPSQN